MIAISGGTIGAACRTHPVRGQGHRPTCEDTSAMADGRPTPGPGERTRGDERSHEMSDRRSLPDRPSLRHLRDEAKARRRAGEFPTLSLAQLAVAREYGFSSWPRLKLHVDALTLDGTERAEGLVRSA